MGLLRQQQNIFVRDAGLFVQKKICHIMGTATNEDSSRESGQQI